MSNPTVTPFSFQTSTIRTVTLDGEHWFVGKDVCNALGYANPSDAIKQHCRGVAKRYPIVDALGRTQEVRIIREPDLYRLIVGSTLPAAQEFEAWVFEEVLPTLRKTGISIHAPRMGGDTSCDSSLKWYTAKELAALWGMNRRTVQRRMVKLVEAGRVEMLPRRNRKLPHHYLFPDGEAPETCPEPGLPALCKTDSQLELECLEATNRQLQLRIMGLESDLIQQSIELDELKRQNAESQSAQRPGPEWHTMHEIATAWNMVRSKAALRVTDMTRKGEVEVMPAKNPWQPYFYRFKNTPVPPATPRKKVLESRRYFQGFMENGKLSLEEYDPAYDFADIPRWLLEDAFFTDGSRERRDNKELLLEIAHVATMRAEYGAEETRRILDGAPETPDFPMIPKLQ